MNPSDRWFKARRRLVGVVFLLLLGFLIWLSLALYNKQFTAVDLVTLHTDSVGNELHLDAQVLVRGVQVGEVQSITATGSGATLTLAIQPGMVSELPANVTAQMVPTTLFGERYVDLILPAHPVAKRLGNGSVIGQDDSRDAIEVEEVLNNLEPMLTAVQPQDLDVTLTAISQALQDRGGELGTTLDELNAYLHKFNPDLPALDRDISELAQVAKTYSQAAPSIVQALNDFSVTSQTILNQQENLSALYTTLTQATQDLNLFLNENSGNVIGLSTDGLPGLQILARYASEFPCILEYLKEFIPNMNKVLGAGTDQPGLHATVNVVQPLANSTDSIGQYTYPNDLPVYRDNTGPHCYGIPFPGITLDDGATTPTSYPSTLGSSGQPGSAGAGGPASLAAGTGLSLANSPQENELVNELAGASLGVAPSSLPDWSSILVGPVYRGREVRLR
jgi:phospholipid/cholesterol/gamma-HCH transport system substrate-binding protein